MPPLTISAIIDRRFVGIARIPPSGSVVTQRFATVSEPVDGGVSFLDTWAATGGGPLGNTRSTLWASDLRIQAIGTKDQVTAIGGLVSVGSRPSLRLEFVNPGAAFAPSSTISLESQATAQSRVIRIRGMPSTTIGPMMVFTDGTQPYRAPLSRHDPAISGSGVQEFATAQTGVAFGDDVIELPPTSSSSPGRVLITGRCEGMGSFAGLAGSSYQGLNPRLGWTTFPLNNTSISIGPPGQFIDLVTAGVRTFTGPVRAATDGSQFVYLGGESNARTMLVERRAVGDLSVTSPALQSSGPMTLVDMVRGPQGIFVLAWVDSAVTFAGLPVSWTPGTGANVVVIALHPTQGTSVRTWNLPNDQWPVAFEHADGTLAILVNDGSSAQFWRTPTP